MTSLYANIGGSRKTISSVYCRKSGSRKQIYPYNNQTVYYWDCYNVIKTESGTATRDYLEEYSSSGSFVMGYTFWYGNSATLMEDGTISLYPGDFVSPQPDNSDGSIGRYMSESGSDGLNINDVYVDWYHTYNPTGSVYTCYYSTKLRVRTETYTTYDYSCGSTYYGQVSSTNKNYYPKNDVSGDYWYIYSHSA